MIIEIDDEVFAFLQSRARPLIDTPNDVLRHILLGVGSNIETGSSLAIVAENRRDESQSVINSRDKSLKVLNREEEYRREFCDYLLLNEFGGGFEKIRGYSWMFEAEEQIVYFQNFNKASRRIWYRLHAGAIKILKATNKRAIVCFTNPIEAFAYRIPYEDIEKKIKASGWSRDSLEVNIDHKYSRWLELEWNISEFLKSFDEWKTTR